MSLPKPLFRDPDRVRVAYSLELGEYLARCIDCGTRLLTAADARTCRRLALERRKTHVCVGEGEIPY